MKYPVILCIFLFMVLPAFGQVSFKNQLEFTHWDEFDRDIIENWTDLSYQRQWLQIGLRYEINDPPDPFIFPQQGLLKEYDLTYRFARIRYKRLNATVGNFYAMFGRGLTLRTYEDRNLRVDNNIDGLKLNIGGKGFKAQALAGKMRDKYNRRKDVIYGLDGEFSPVKKLHVGGSVLYQDEPNSQSSGLWSGRLQYTRDLWDFYGEVVRPDWHDAFSYYLAANIFYRQLALSLEYKDYNQMSFANHYGTEYNAAPSLSREHSFALLNRHPHALNQDDEKGYQVEATYTPLDEIQFVFNHSQTFTQQNRRFFEEYYAEMLHYFSDNLEYRAAAAWAYDFTTNTENITPLIDGSFSLSDRDQIHVSLQHQHTKNRFDKSEYDNELVLLEYSRSPFMSAGLIAEYTNKDQLKNVQLDRNYWLCGILTFNFLSNQQLSLLYGSRREGFVCVGGICRYEPEFEGIEIKLVNRF